MQSANYKSKFSLNKYTYYIYFINCYVITSDRNYQCFLSGHLFRLRKLTIQGNLTANSILSQVRVYHEFHRHLFFILVKKISLFLEAQKI